MLELSVFMYVYMCVCVYSHQLMLFERLRKLWIIWQKKYAHLSVWILQFVLTFTFRVLCFLTRFIHIQIKVDSKYGQSARKITKQKLKLRVVLYASVHIKDFLLKMKHVKDVNKLVMGTLHTAMITSMRCCPLSNAHFEFRT